MKFRVVISQEDVSTKLWTLGELMKYLRGILRIKPALRLEWEDTVIHIVRME